MAVLVVPAAPGWPSQSQPGTPDHVPKITFWLPTGSARFLALPQALQAAPSAPGCPRLPQAAPTYPTSRRVAFLAPRDLYVEAPRLGRGVADLGRTYAGSAGAPRQEAPGPERTPARTHADLRDTINRPNLRRGKGTNVTTRAARSTAVSFRTPTGAPPRPGCPATASVDAAAARPASSGATWPGTL